jgi:hypothetical protein
MDTNRVKVVTSLTWVAQGRAICALSSTFQQRWPATYTPVGLLYSFRLARFTFLISIT